MNDKYILSPLAYQRACKRIYHRELWSIDIVAAIKFYYLMAKRFIPLYSITHYPDGKLVATFQTSPHSWDSLHIN